MLLRLRNLLCPVVALAMMAPVVLTAKTLPEKMPPKSVSLREGKLFLKPDTSSAVVGEVRPGDSVAIFERSPGFARVFVKASGWMVDKGMVALSDAKAPAVIFGAATQLQNKAESGPGETQTAKDAARLYFQVYENFPQNPLAAEALYRAADIKWQLDSADLPLVHDPTDRQFPDDHWLNKVKSQYSGTPWAARAAYILLQKHFTCGEWVEKPGCIQKEINVYRDYLHDYPKSPLAAEAAYQIVYRDGAAWSVYAADGPQHDAGKAEQYARETQEQAAAVASQYPGTDWAAQAQLIAFEVNQGVPVYGRSLP